MKSKMIMPQEVFRVVVDDCRFRRHNGYSCVEWFFRILDGQWAGKTLTKYNNLNGKAAAALFEEEVSILGVSLKDYSEFRSITPKLIGKELYVRYGLNDAGYPQTEIDFDRTSDLYMEDILEESWKLFPSNNTDNNI